MSARGAGLQIQFNTGSIPVLVSKIKPMPPKKKTNYISYELKKLENYLTQLNNTLDLNPPDRAADRIEILQTARGGQN